MAQDRDWTTLFKIGGLAALLAGLLFRRNLGAEASLLVGVDVIPTAVVEWYALLQSNPWLGLAFLAVFDLANYALEALVFLALCAALWHGHRSVAVIALASGLVGTAVGFAANISLTMLSLSQQYAAATSAAQKASLLDAGQAVLASNNPLVTFPGTGAYVSLLLIAVAGLLYSLLLLAPHRTTAIFGLLASGCDLAYCLTFLLAPSLQVVWLASGGLFWMIWHLLIARMLLKLARE